MCPCVFPVLTLEWPPAAKELLLHFHLLRDHCASENSACALLFFNSNSLTPVLIYGKILAPGGVNEDLCRPQPRGKPFPLLKLSCLSTTRPQKQHTCGWLCLAALGWPPNLAVGAAVFPVLLVSHSTKPEKGAPFPAALQCRVDAWSERSKPLFQLPVLKIRLICSPHMEDISDIKLIRTDTTLDLSQKAEKR